MQEYVEEYLGPVNADPSLTSDAKDKITFHVNNFAKFVEAKQSVPQEAAPMYEGEPTPMPEEKPVELG